MLAGMFVIVKNGEGGCLTGEIKDQPMPGTLLVGFDVMEIGPDAPPLWPDEVVPIEELTMICESCGERHWRLFKSRKDMMRWLDWAQKPSTGNKVVKLVDSKHPKKPH